MLFHYLIPDLWCSYVYIPRLGRKQSGEEDRSELGACQTVDDEVDTAVEDDKVSGELVHHELPLRGGVAVGEATEDHQPEPDSGTESVEDVVWAGANLEISNIPRINLGRLSMRNVRTTVKRILVIWTSLPWAIVNPKERNLQ